MPEALVSYLAMDGYAAFVWPSYAISLIALMALGFASFRRMKRLEAAAEAQRRGSRGDAP